MTLVAALVCVMLGIGRQEEVVAAQRDAVQAQVATLTASDRKVQAATEKFAAAEAEAESLRKLLVARAAAAQRVNAVRDSLLPGMWIERWDDGRLTVRYWSDRVKGQGGKTPGELVVDKLKGRPCIDADTVKISDMSALGKDAQVEQFTVEMKFK